MFFKTLLRMEQIWGLRTFVRPCREVTFLASQSLDRELKLFERLSMRLHFLYCKWCRWYLEQLRSVQSRVRREADEEAAQPAGSLSPAARRRIRQAVARADTE